MSTVISLTPDLKTNAVGQNWWFLLWQISVVLIYCLLIQGDIDKERDFCGEIKLRGFTWFHLESVSLHLSSLLPSGELCLVYLISDDFRDKMRNVFVLSSAFSDFWPWKAPYVPGIIIILGTSPLLTVLCRWREWRLLPIPSENEVYATFFFLWFRHPKKWLCTEVVTSLFAADMESACPRKVYFHPIPASPSIGTAEVRLQPAPLSVSCGAVRGLGDDPRNLRRKSVNIERENMSDQSFPTHIQRDGSGDRR